VSFTARRIQSRGFLQFADGLRDFAVLKQCLSEREMRAVEFGRELNHFPQLLDFLCWSVVGTGSVGQREVVERLHRGRRQRHRFLELADRFGGIRRREGGAEIRPRVGVFRTDSHSLAQCRDPTHIVASLDQHEAEIVVGFGEVGAQLDRFAECARDVAAAGARSPEQQTQRVVCIRPIGVCRQRLAQAGDRTVPVGRWLRRRRHVQPGL
jgi:hypothetical protein